MNPIAATVPEKVIKHALILIAMEAEAEPLLKALNLQKINSDSEYSPFIIYSGSYKNFVVSVVTNGKCNKFGVDNVGTTPAAIAAFSTINQLKPDIVINAGTAGGYKSKGANIGDVFVATKIYHHDRRIPIPGFAEYGRGDHSGIDVPQLISALNFKTGNISTSNSLDHSQTDDEIITQNNASVKDMEAAAIAWVCELSATPLLTIKVVTDIVDGDRPTQEEFFENLSSAANALQKAVPNVIDFIVGKTISQL